MKIWPRNRYGSELATLCMGLLLLFGCRSEPERSAMAQTPAEGGVPSAERAVAQSGLPDVTLRRLWSGSDFNFFASNPSPDGRWVTEIDWTTGDLAVRDLVTGQLHRLTDKGPWVLSGDYAEVARFSPDGRRIVYGWYVDATATYEVRLLDFTVDDAGVPHGSEPRIVHPGRPLYAFWLYGWTDDDEILAGLYRPDNSTALGFLSLSSSEIRVLKSFDWADARAALSRDGRFVAYDHPTGADPRERDIHLLSVDGSRETTIVEGPGSDVVLGWGPGDRSVLFYSERSGSPSIWRLPMADGQTVGEPELVREDVRNLEPLGFAGDAFYFGVEVDAPRFRTSRIDPEGGRLEPLRTVFENPYGGPLPAFDWSPDGEHSAQAVSLGQASASLFIHAADGRVFREWNLRLRLLRWMLRWTPDGSSILLAGQDERGRAGFFQVDLESGTPELIRRFDQDSGRLFSISPDGEHLYFTRVGSSPEGSDERIIEIVSRDLASGTERAIHRVAYPAVDLRGGHSSPLAVSPDGRVIAYPIFTSADASIRFLSVDGPADRTPDPFAAPGLRELVGWTPDGNLLLYMVRSASSEPGLWSAEDVELWGASRDGARTERLGVIRDYVGGARLHPDGRTLAYRAGRSRGEIWALDSLVPDAATTGAVESRPSR